MDDRDHSADDADAPIGSTPPGPRREEQPTQELRLPGGEGAGAEEPPVGSTGSASETVFRPGQLISNRYRIKRFIAAGGRGEVYEAHDLELGERIALKCVHPRLADDAHAVLRFKREINLARRVTHPNVCRIFDVGVERVGDGPPVLFLTMELLRGEALDERLDRVGALAPDRVRWILAQLCRGLTAAHAAGVVHRDFKTDNVLLVPGPEGERAVITDFGLARAMESESSSMSRLTATGKVVGTPAYMAPEQLEGGEVGPWSDLYALGIVTFEMLSGRLPFVGKTPLSVAMKRLQEAPPSLRAQRPELDPTWERLVKRCLARDPKARFASAPEVKAALTGEPASPSPLRHRGWALVGAALLVAGIGLGIWWLLPAGAPPEPSLVPPATGRLEVAILPIQSLDAASEVDWHTVALTELIGLELQATGVISPLPAGVTPRHAEAATTANLLHRVEKRSGAEAAIGGTSLTLAGERGRRLRLDLWIRSAEGDLSALASSVDRLEQMPLIAHRVATGLWQELALSGGIPPPPGETEPVIAAGLPALQQWARGMRLAEASSPAAAIQHMRRATELAPKVAVFWLALARLEARSGDAAAARRAAVHAEAAAESLPGALRLEILARAAELQGEWERAAALWQTLLEFYPEDLTSVLGVARCQGRLGATRRATALLEQQRGSHPSPLEQVRIDLVKGSLAGAAGDVDEARSLYRRAAQTAVKSEAMELAARARRKLEALEPTSNESRDRDSAAASAGRAESR